MARIYIAAAKGEAFLADALGSTLHTMGHTITSTWHASGPIDVDPDSIRERGLVACSCLAEIEQAEHVVALAHVGEPCGMYTEIGVALGLSKGVSWFQGVSRGANVFDASPCVDRTILPRASTFRDANMLAHLVDLDIFRAK